MSSKGKDAKSSPSTSEGLIETGTEASGGAIGAAVGLLIGGPPGSIIGGAVGPVAVHTIRRIATEISRRIFGRREEDRIASALTFAADKIRSNLEQHKQFRGDRFFDSSVDDPSAAEETIEALLLSAQREYEEKKLRYHGNLLANLCFAEGIDKPLTNVIIRLFDRISYRQVLLLSFINRVTELEIPFQTVIGVMKEGAMRVVPEDILYETKELANLDLIEFEMILPSIINYNPRTFKMTRMGDLLFDLAELGTVEKQEIDFFVRLIT